MLIRFTSLFLILLSIASCGDPSKIKWTMPVGRIYSYMPKTDNEVYKHAWMDGCESGISTGFSKEFAKAFHVYKKDIRFVGYKYGDERDLFNGKEITQKDKDLYSRVWFDTYKVCRHYGLSMYIPYQPKQPGQAALDLDDISQIYEIRNWNNADGNIDFW